MSFEVSYVLSPGWSHVSNISFPDFDEISYRRLAKTSLPSPTLRHLFRFLTAVDLLSGPIRTSTSSLLDTAPRSFPASQAPTTCFRTTHSLETVQRRSTVFQDSFTTAAHCRYPVSAAAFPPAYRPQAEPAASPALSHYRPRETHPAQDAFPGSPARCFGRGLHHLARTSVFFAYCHHWPHCQLYQ